MLHRITPYWLITLLLACPFFCMGNAFGACFMSCHADSCCCTQDTGQSGEEAPPSPSGNDSDCLCHGAVMGGRSTTQTDCSMCLTNRWLMDGPVLFSSDLSLTAVSLEPPHQFPPFSMGRDLCALTGVLLL